MTNLPIALRQASADDLAFFYSATLQSHFYSSPTNRDVLPSIYYPEHKMVLEDLLKRPTALLDIACLKDDPDVIIGFALAEPGEYVLHYMYVKRAFRRFGVATEILGYMGLELSRCTVTHVTDDLLTISKSKQYPNLTYNPYLLME